MTHIKQYIIKRVIPFLTWCFILVCFAGCTSLNIRTGQKPEKYPGDMKDDSFYYGDSKSKLEKYPSDFKDINSYYDYLESELHKKKGEIDKAIVFLDRAIKKNPDSLFLKNELAVLYLHQNDYDNALSIIEDVLNQNPDDLEALILYGSIKQSLKEYDDAIIAFEKVIALDPEQKKIYLFLGSIYMYKDQMDKAREIYQKMVEKYPDAYVGYYFLGKISIKQGNLNIAEKEFSKALDIEPMLLEPRFELLKIYRQDEESDKDIKGSSVTVKKGDSLHKLCMKMYGRYNADIRKTVLDANPALKNPDKLLLGQQIFFPVMTQKNKEKIIRVYEEILDHYPQNIKAAMELGLYYEKNEMKKEAAGIFAELGRRSFEEKNIFEKIVILYIKNKAYQDAITILEGMLNGLPDNSDIHYFLGIAYDSIDDKEKAIQNFLAVDHGSASFENATIYAAYLLQTQKKTAQAIRHLETGIQKQPESIDFYLILAQFYEDMEKFKNAETTLTKGLEANPDNTQLLFRSGVLYDKWEKKETSIGIMKKIIALDPEHAQALNYLGYTYLELNRNLNEAEKLIRKAVELKPEDGYITDSLGWVYYKKGNYKKAAEILEHAISLVPDDPIILEHAGDAYLKLNDRKKALEFYERSLSITKEDTEVLQKKIDDLK